LNPYALKKCKTSVDNLIPFVNEKKLGPEAEFNLPAWEDSDEGHVGVEEIDSDEN
jgi:hypothetical protein